MIILAGPGFGQHALTLHECYERAERNYPMLKQRRLIELSAEHSVSNAAKGALPRIALGGQATYQSDVTRIPLEMPGIEPLSKDQYKVFADVSQTLYGGVTHEQKQVAKLNAEVDRKKLEVDLYGLRSRINDLFFGILLLRAQQHLAELKKADVQSALKKVQAAVDNGSAIGSAAAALKAELLRMEQRLVEVASSDESYREMLGLFIGEPLPPDIPLEKPVFHEMPSTIDRPELRFFESQNQLLEASKNILHARKAPRLELFVQGGYGRPALNMLENEFHFYYVGGLRFTWPLAAYYTLKREDQLLSIQQQSLDVQQETFLFNTGLQVRQHQSEIVKLQKLADVDRDIIRLRVQVRHAAEVQLEEGVITSADFIRELNAEDEAKQNLALHEIELLLAKAKYQFTLGQ